MPPRPALEEAEGAGSAETVGTGIGAAACNSLTCHGVRVRYCHVDGCAMLAVNPVMLQQGEEEKA